jgi:hypothetical protein
MQIIKKICIPRDKNKNKIPLPMLKTKRICIAYAEIKKNLHCNARNKKTALAEKLKTICSAHAENKKKLPSQCKK